MSKKASAKRAEEEAKLRQAIKDHPYKPSKIAELARFYMDYSRVESGEEAKRLRRKGYDTFVETIAKFDELKFTKDKNGARIKLDKKEINKKCDTLARLSVMSAEQDIMATPSEVADNDGDIEDPKMLGEIYKCYWMFRTE